MNNGTISISSTLQNSARRPLPYGASLGAGDTYDTSFANFFNTVHNDNLSQIGAHHHVGGSDWITGDITSPHHLMNTISNESSLPLLSRSHSCRPGREANRVLCISASARALPTRAPATPNPEQLVLIEEYLNSLGAQITKRELLSATFASAPNTGGHGRTLAKWQQLEQEQEHRERNTPSTLLELKQASQTQHAPLDWDTQSTSF